MAKKNRTKANMTFQTEFPVDLLVNQDGQELVCIGTHTYYNLDGKVKLAEWMRGDNLPKCIKTFGTTDGIKVYDKNGKDLRGTICDGSLGYLTVKGNGVSENAQGVNITSLPYVNGNGFNLLPENFDRAVAGFAARRLVVDNVWNDTDEYMAPGTENSKYAEWQKDCYIISMFDHQSYQTSIKGEVDGEAYEFNNNFYPLTKEETYKLLALDKKANFKDDARFIRSSGKLDNLTPEGKKVLDDFKACLKASASARPAYSKAHPELQVQRWDCGWRQLKGLFEEDCPDQFNQLKADFKALKDKMLPLVYELGFLRK